MTCNANPRYTEYWPVAAAAWLRLDITPVCLFIPDNQTVKLPKIPGSIAHTIPPLKDVHIIIQLFMLRFWASWLYPNATVIISDIDLIPLSKDFFCTQLFPYPDEAYLHLGVRRGKYNFTTISDIPEKITHLDKVRHITAHLHAAKGEVMHKVLQFSSDWETSCKKTVPYFLHKSSKLKMNILRYDGSAPWAGDDIYTSIRLHHSNHHPMFYGYDDKNQNSSVESTSLRKKHTFHFVHISGPYSENKWIIEGLIVKGTLPKLCISALELIGRIPHLKKKNGKNRDWLSYAIIILAWIVLRILKLLHISPSFEAHLKFVLADLWYQHDVLRRRNPRIDRLYHQYQRIIRSLFS